MQPARRELDDRLERDLVDVAQAEEVVERLHLDELARRRHPDPVGEARQLDRLGHRGDVALALLEGRVEVDEAVRRGVDLLRDRRRPRVGQLRRRPDDDHPGFELEHASAGGGLGQPGRETDVAGPEEAFGGGFPLEEAHVTPPSGSIRADAGT